MLIMQIFQPSGHNHSTVTKHTHATEPYLQCNLCAWIRELKEWRQVQRDSIFVSWSHGLFKEFQPGPRVLSCLLTEMGRMPQELHVDVT